MIRQDAYFQIIEEKAPETLPPRPIEEPANPVSGLLITSAAIPSIASLGTVVWVGASIASWLFAGASWLCLAIVLLARQRHVAHWKLQRHLYDLKSGMYTYYVISQGVPRAEPDSARLIAEHFPEAGRTVRNLRPTIAPDDSGHFPSRELQLARQHKGESYAVLWETHRLGRLANSCDQCRWWRLVDQTLSPFAGRRRSRCSSHRPC